MYMILLRKLNNHRYIIAAVFTLLVVSSAATLTFNNNYSKIVNAIKVEQWVTENINIDIAKLSAELTQKNNEYVTSQLKIQCLKSQLNRLLDWLEYSIEYCDNSENLKRFELSNLK